MSRRLFLHFWLVLASACADKRSELRAQAEAEKARHAIAAELTVGDSQSKIEEFFRRHGWLFDFDQFLVCFRAVVYRAPEKTHQVTAYIYVNGKRQLVRTEVDVAVTFL